MTSLGSEPVTPVRGYALPYDVGIAEGVKAEPVPPLAVGLAVGTGDDVAVAMGTGVAVGADVAVAIGTGVAVGADVAVAIGTGVAAPPGPPLGADDLGTGVAVTTPVGDGAALGELVVDAEVESAAPEPVVLADWLAAEEWPAWLACVAADAAEQPARASPPMAPMTQPAMTRVR